MERWAVRAQNKTEDVERPVYKRGLSYEEAEVWRNRYNSQGYNIVAVMRERRAYQS
jgi:hypothetical protein